MKRLFADTFFFFAYLNPDDAAHSAAERYFDGFDGQIVTTGWILTEIADGMAGIGDRTIFVELHNALLADPAVTIIPCNPESFAEGVELYAARKDKEWTLTDCISFAVMKREGLTEALTADRHFKQAGFIALLA